MAIRTSETLPIAFTVEKIGLGAGKREQELPGFVRAMLIEPTGVEVTRPLAGSVARWNDAQEVLGP